MGNNIYANEKVYCVCMGVRRAVCLSSLLWCASNTVCCCTCFSFKLFSFKFSFLVALSQIYSTKMANRPKGYGMSAELARKKESKFDADLANDCLEWMRLVLKDGGFDTEADTLNEVSTSQAVVAPLKDGTVLCKLINCIKPGSVKKVNDSKMTFKMMENIQNFLTACEAIGCKKQDLFQTVDLFEGQNVPQVSFFSDHSSIY